MIRSSPPASRKNYELIEYINDVNREYTEVLAEQSVHGRTDTSYIYGVGRLSLDGYNGCSGYYLYDPRGSVTGITGEWGQLYQSYRYSVTGEITFGAPTYENEYTYNGESYNPNIESQYLRARYYDVVNANFLTEDSYLGDIAEPLTLNRYNYCVSSYPNYQDPSGYLITAGIGAIVGGIAGFAIGMVGEAMAYADAKANGEDYDLTKGILNVANSTATGVVGGTVFGATGNPVLAGGAAGATGSFLSSTTEAIYYDGNISSDDVKNIATQTVIGTVSGGITGAAGGILGKGIVAIGASAIGQTAVGTVLQTTLSVGGASAIGVLGGTVYRDLNGQDTTLDDIKRDALLGAVGGAVGTVAQYGVTKYINRTTSSNRNSSSNNKTAVSADADEAIAKAKADNCDIAETVTKVSTAAKSGSTSRYDRTGYQSNGRSNNLFGRDRSTRRTTNLTEWRRSISQQDIHNEMRLFLGDDYVKVDSGKWRSLDGTRQFRVKPDDYLGNHGIGQPTVPNTPHVHFEFLTPRSNGNGFDVIKNIHVPIK